MVKVGTPLTNNMLNPKMKVWMMIFLINWVILRFHVNFPGCNGNGQPIINQPMDISHGLLGVGWLDGWLCWNSTLSQHTDNMVHIKKTKSCAKPCYEIIYIYMYIYICDMIYTVNVLFKFVIPKKS